MDGKSRVTDEQKEDDKEAEPVRLRRRKSSGRGPADTASGAGAAGKKGEVEKAKSLWNGTKTAFSNATLWKSRTKRTVDNIGLQCSWRRLLRSCWFPMKRARKRSCLDSGLCGGCEMQVPRFFRSVRGSGVVEDVAFE